MKPIGRGVRFFTGLLILRRIMSRSQELHDKVAFGGWDYVIVAPLRYYYLRKTYTVQTFRFIVIH